MWRCGVERSSFRLKGFNPSALQATCGNVMAIERLTKHGANLRTRLAVSELGHGDCTCDMYGHPFANIYYLGFSIDFHLVDTIRLVSQLWSLGQPSLRKLLAR
jgi:hypothetical protein